MRDELVSVSNAVEVPPAAADFMVIAQRPEEMRAAQEKTITWIEQLIAENRAAKADAEAALEAAKRNKWRQEGFRRHVTEPEKKIEFYEKILAALKAGYVIVPNFPIDVFAIRTKRKEPKGDVENFHWANFRQESERLPVGAGSYVDSKPEIAHETHEEANKEGKMVTRHEYWPTAFLPVDFPIKMVAPQVMDATGRAMALKAFDEIGILPSRREARGQDPMVIGQVAYRAGANVKRVSFLVAWWLTADDLRV